MLKGSERGLCYERKYFGPRLLREGDVVNIKKEYKIYVGESHDAVVAGKEFRGRYVVVKTSADGGGQIAGINRFDYHENGHHVWCRRLLDNCKLGDVIHFYQNGSFTAEIPNIRSVGEMNLDNLPHSQVKI